ncbi:MAG: hypothetical protein JXA71_04790 [Chitinispirillaceae bacterium]|nr:hypothetical protein [Chitinispirillaceae bacterium]
MNSIKCFFSCLYRTITLGAVAFTVWKVVGYWQKRNAEIPGGAIDESSGVDAEKRGQTAGKAAAEGRRRHGGNPEGGPR